MSQPHKPTPFGISILIIILGLLFCAAGFCVLNAHPVVASLFMFLPGIGGVVTGCVILLVTLD